MNAEIISGTETAKKLLEKKLKPRVDKLLEQKIYPKLVVILVGEHAASASYVRQKEKFAEKANIKSEIWRYPDTVNEQKILSEISRINEDKTIHGVIVQLPLPEHISVEKILKAIDPKKDVDGFTPENIGNLFLGKPCLPCCTPRGVITMLKENGENLEGKNVVVIGRSNIVGKPVAIMALNENATVKILHSKSRDLTRKMQHADIIIVAVGKPEFLHGDQIPKNCTIIDVGIHRTDEGKLVGDVHANSAMKKARKISPVPGGVGPMTVYSLIENTVTAAESQ